MTTIKKVQKLAFVLLMAIASTKLHAQTNTFPATGDVGIGTTSPGANLDVRAPHVYVGGAVGNSNTGAEVQLRGWNTGFNNWQISTAFQASNGLDITPSTTPGGTTYTTPAVSILRNGNVGIGTTNPAQKLDVNGTIRVHGSLEGGAGSGAGTLTLYGDYTSLAGVTIQQNGNVGIGTTSPANILTIKGNNHPNPEGIQLMAPGYGGYTKLTTADAIDGMGSSFYQQFKLTIKDFQNAELDAFKIQMSTGVVQTTFPTGNVGIGTTSPGYKLDVIGTIHAQEVIVDTSGADYVFKPNYKLMPLSQIEQAIKKDQHLPGIPSAQQMSSGGMNMGDLQTKLLAKVEELTLHQIEQEKRIDRLERENAELREKVNP